MGGVPFLSSLKAVAASAIALAIAASTGVALSATVLAPVDATIAVPAVVDAELADQLAERDALVSSRDAERQALDDATTAAVAARTTQLSSTGSAIDATEQAIQEQKAAEQKAAEEAAAKKKAEEEAAAKAAAAKPTGGTRAQNKELARYLAKTLYGWGEEQFACYNNIIMRESLWDTYADNPTSSAYGIPQALPGKKMASEGSDWKTNPETQIRWGLKYIKERYGTPCKGWSFKRANGWY